MSENLTTFRNACGLSDALRLVVEEPGRQPVVHTFSQPFALIGRAAYADLVLEDEAVSRSHAYVQALGGRLYCADLASRTGVHWPEGPRRAGWLGHEPVRIGRAQLRLFDDAPEPEPPLAADPLASGSVSADAWPAVTFDFLQGSLVRAPWRLDRLLTLAGRAPGSKVRFVDPAVPPLACALVWTPAGIWAVAPTTRTTLSLAGTPGRFWRLQEGDVLSIAGLRLGVHCLWRGAVGSGQLVAAGSMAATRDETVDRARFARELLVPLLEQFRRTQDQMLDDFQEAVTVMARQFGRLHRRQMRRLTLELNRLEAVTREVQALKAELTRRGLPAASAEAQPAAPNLPRPEEDPLATQAETVFDVPIPTPQASDAVAAADPSLSLVPPAGASDADIHAWLCDRLEALQRERRGRWQRMVSFLKGNTPAENDA